MKRFFSILMVVVILFSVELIPGLMDEGIMIYSQAADYQVGDLIEFGGYPQRQVTDSTLISLLDSQTKIWVSYDYYYGVKKTSDYMRYADFYYNGQKYRAVTFDHYRPSWSSKKESLPLTHTNVSYQDDNGFYPDNVYYFLFEPLKWRVLDPKEGLVLCESIIDSQPYQNTTYNEDSIVWQDETKTYYAIDYSKSSIRQWLIDCFFNTAFSASEQKNIGKTFIAGKNYSSTYVSESTSDQLFLLPIEVVQNDDYWLSSDESKSAFASDYSKCQGVFISDSSTTKNRVSWWIQAPGKGSTSTCTVGSDGRCWYGMARDVGYVYVTFEGVRPAFHFASGIVEDKNPEGGKIYTPTTYTVNYNANGGTNSPSAQIKTKNVKMKITSALPSKEYTVLFNSNGGIVTQTSKRVSCVFRWWNTKKDGSGNSYLPGDQYTDDANVTMYAQWTEPAVGILEEPTRSGYKFNGWYTAPSGGSQITQYSNITADTTLYAHWTEIEKQTFTVSYSANGGSDAPAAQTKTEGKALPLSNTKPTKAYTITCNANGGSVSPASKTVSCVFKNWNTKSDGTGTAYAPGASYATDASVTLYAQWTNPTFGTLPTPTRSSYTFDGWYTATSGGTKITASSTVAKSQTLYAHWSKIMTYTVDYNPNGGTGAPAGQSKTAGTALKLSGTVPVKSFRLVYDANGGSVATATKTVSCTFKSWNTKSDGSGTAYAPGASYTKDANLTLYAQWTNPTAGTLATPTRSGYTFDGWYTAVTGGTKITASSTVTKSQTLYAHWTVVQKKTYSVSFNANGGSGAPAGQTKTEGTMLRLSGTVPTKALTLTYDGNGGSVSPASKTVSCTFKSWNTKSDGSGTSYAPGASYTKDANLTLYAQWTNPTVGTLPTPTRSGYTFSGWYTAASGGTKITSSSTVAKAQTLYAHWTAVPKGTFTVSYNANGGTGAPAAQTKTQGKALTLSATKPTKSFKITYNANGGSVSPASKTVSCTFRNWNTKSDGSGTSYAPGAGYTKDANLTLYAQWTNPTAGTLPTPTRSGYTFNGWYTAASGGTKITSSSTITKSQTLYAHWNKTPESKPYLDTAEQFGFANSYNNFGKEYYISDQDLLKLTNYVRALYRNDPAKAATVINKIQSLRHSQWGGSCYGMSVTAILDKLNAIGFNENFDPDAKTISAVDSPSRNKAVESAINYYHLSQVIPYLYTYRCKYYEKGQSDWKAGLKQLVSMSQDGKPILFSYWFYPANKMDIAGHAIVVKGCRKAADGSHQIIAYDNRYPNRDVIIKVDAAYSSCVVDGRENAIAVQYIEDMSGFDVIDIDGPDNRYTADALVGSVIDDEAFHEAQNTISAADNSATITVMARGKVTVENDDGETLILENGGVTGTMDVANRSIMVASTEGGDDCPFFTFTVMNSDSFTFESTDPEMSVSVQSANVYGEAKTNGAKFVVISKNDGVYALGNDFLYDLSLSVNTDLCDMVSISGDADNDVKLTFKGEKIKASGVDRESGIITVFSNTVDTDLYSYSAGYDSFVIASAKSGGAEKISIMGSSQSNGIYDTSIGSRYEEKDGGKMGDIDGDGKISSGDARLALRASVGLEKDIKKGTDAWQRCDVDNNGSVTSGDARLILRASVGLEDASKWKK